MIVITLKPIEHPALLTDRYFACPICHRVGVALGPVEGGTLLFKSHDSIKHVTLTRGRFIDG